MELRCGQMRNIAALKNYVDRDRDDIYIYIYNVK